MRRNEHHAQVGRLDPSICPGEDEARKSKSGVTERQAQQQSVNEQGEQQWKSQFPVLTHPRAACQVCRPWRCHLGGPRDEPHASHCVDSHSSTDSRREGSHVTLAATPGSEDRAATDSAGTTVNRACPRTPSSVLADIRAGDTLHVRALDLLGRDALDVQATVGPLLEKGVTINVQGLGTMARRVEDVILEAAAQIADIERDRIRERTEAGRDKARASLLESGLTHNGKASRGRPRLNDRKASPSGALTMTQASPALPNTSVVRQRVSKGTVRRRQALLTRRWAKERRTLTRVAVAAQCGLAYSRLLHCEAADATGLEFCLYGSLRNS